MYTKLVPKSKHKVVSVDFGDLRPDTKAKCRKLLAKNPAELAFEFDPKQKAYTVNVQFVEKRSITPKKKSQPSNKRTVPRLQPKEIDRILPAGDDWGVCVGDAPWEEDSVIEDRKLFGGHFHENPARQQKYTVPGLSSGEDDEEELDYVEKRFRLLQDYEEHFHQVDILDRSFVPRLKTLRGGSKATESPWPLHS